MVPAAGPAHGVGLEVVSRVVAVPGVARDVAEHGVVGLDGKVVVLCVCVYVCVCMCVCLCMYMCICTYVYLCCIYV